MEQLNPHANILKFSENRVVHNKITDDLSSAPVPKTKDSATFDPIRDASIDHSVLQDMGAWQIIISDFFATLW
jgi:hypothetical protein